MSEMTKMDELFESITESMLYNYGNQYDDQDTRTVIENLRLLALDGLRLRAEVKELLAICDAHNVPVPIRIARQHNPVVEEAMQKLAKGEIDLS